MCSDAQKRPQNKKVCAKIDTKSFLGYFNLAIRGHFNNIQTVYLKWSSQICNARNADMRIVRKLNSALNAAENSRLNALIVATLYLLRHYFAMNVGIA
jgi:hypothetical protein